MCSQRICTMAQRCIAAHASQPASQPACVMCGFCVCHRSVGPEGCCVCRCSCMRCYCWCNLQLQQAACFVCAIFSTLKWHAAVVAAALQWGVPVKQFDYLPGLRVTYFYSSHVCVPFDWRAVLWGHRPCKHAVRTKPVVCMLPAHKVGFTVWHVWQFPMLCGDWVVGCLLIVWTRICIVSFALVAKVEPACTTAPLLQASHGALLANAVLTVWSQVVWVGRLQNGFALLPLYQWSIKARHHSSGQVVTSPASLASQWHCCIVVQLRWHMLSRILRCLAAACCSVAV